MHTFRPRMRPAKLVATLIVLVGAARWFGVVTSASASAWSPTLLVNTESFQVIDEGDSLTDVEIRFGDTLNEKIYWNRAPARFEFTDDVHVQGNITTSGAIIVTSDSKFKGDITINSDQGAADTILTFGSDTTNETLKFLNNEDRFEFSDDLNVTGGLYASGALIVGGAGSVKGDFTLNSDSGAADAILTFGSDTANETLKFLNNEDRFEFSDDLHATGNITGSGSLKVDGAITTEGNLTLNQDQTDGNTVLTFGSDDTNETVTFIDAEDRFEFSDDLNVTGQLYASGTTILGGDAKVKGDLTINSDQGTADTILTFGSDTTNETAKFLNAEDRFEFSDDVRITGGTYASGALIVDGAATFKSTIKLNGVTYTFPTSDGSASGKVLKTDSAGTLSWSTDSGTAPVVRSSGGMVFLQPEFPHAVYVGSGAATATIGTLGLRYDSGSTVNFYRWQSTKTSNQQYWIVSRIRVPDQFSSWDIQKPIEFRNRSSGGWLELRMLDTGGNAVTLSSHTNIRNSAWTTTTVTGPQTSGTFASGGYLTLMVKMVSSGALVANRAYADVGFINLNMETKTVGKQ